MAVYTIDPVELSAGSLPRRQQRLVEAWAELHQAELAADFDPATPHDWPERADSLKACAEGWEKIHA